MLEKPLPHSAVDRLRGASRIWLVGTGTSQQAAELGAWMFQEAGRAAHAMGSMAFANRTPPFGGGDALVLISHNAGVETAFAGAAWTLATRAGLPAVAITRIGGELPDPVETVSKGLRLMVELFAHTRHQLLAHVTHDVGQGSFAEDAPQRRV